MLAALRNRDFAVLWAGMAISLLGDGVYLVAIAWEAFRLSDSLMALSIVGVAWTLPAVLCLLFGGVISDKFDRRWVLFWAAIGQAASIAAIGALTMLGELTLWMLLCPVVVYGALQAIFTPAFEAIVPNLVSRNELLGASAVDQLVRPFSLQLLGPALGGILIASLGTGVAFMIDAATFVIVAAALLMMGSALPMGSIVRRSSRREIAHGLSFVRANPWLWRTLLAAGLALLAFAGPSQVLLPFLVKNDLHAGSDVFGAIRAAGGIGAMSAALAVGLGGRPRPVMNAMFAAWALQCLALAAYAAASGALLFAFISLTSGAMGAIGNVIWSTLMRTRVPNHLLGRVSSVDWLVSIGLVPLSFAITGPLAQALGARVTLLVAGGLAGATMLLALTWIQTAEGKHLQGTSELVLQDAGA